MRRPGAAPWNSRSTCLASSLVGAMMRHRGALPRLAGVTLFSYTRSRASGLPLQGLNKAVLLPVVEASDGSASAAGEGCTVQERQQLQLAHSLLLCVPGLAPDPGETTEASTSATGAVHGCKGLHAT